MLRIAALLIATYLAAFLTTSALTAPGGMQAAVDRLTGAVALVAAWPSGAHASAARTVAEPESTGTLAATRLRKSAALPRLRGAHAPARLLEPSEIEATPQGRLAIRDADGRLLFLRDPAAGETVIARGARLPRLLAAPTGDDPRLDVAPTTAPGGPATQDDGDDPLAAGCESAVSPLARSRRTASGVLCIAAL